MIKPTVGRVVWFYRGLSDRHDITVYDAHPCAAIVTHVWSDTCVNLSVFGHDGRQHARTLVLLVQPEQQRPQPDAVQYCEWMPYQVGQAKAQQA